MNRNMTSVLMLALVSTLSACQWGTIPDEEFDRLYGDRIKGPGGLSLFYGNEAARMQTTLANKLGSDAQIRSLNLYYDRALFEAQTAQDPSRQMSYTYDDGDLEPDESSSPISASDSQEFFRLSDVPLADLQVLVQQAQKALGVPNKFVRLVSVGLDREYKEYVKAISDGGSPGDLRLRRGFLGPEANPLDKGVRLSFSFGESSAMSRVEMDAFGRIIQVSYPDVVQPGAAPVPSLNLFAGTAMADAATRMEKSLAPTVMQVNRVLVYPTYASFYMVDPKDPSLVETFDFRDGGFRGNSSWNRSQSSGDNPSVPLSQAKLTEIPKWIDAANQALEGNAKAKYVILDAQNPGVPPHVTVYMDVQGRSIWVEMSTEGTNVIVHK